LQLEQLESRTLLSVSLFTPMQIRHAYGVDQITFNQGTVIGDGAGQTIAIVDAFYDPSIQSDLAAFSSRFGLPQLDGKTGHGSFTQLDLSNKTYSPVGDDWTVETALDVEWAHAVAPKANILLAEAASDTSDATGKPTDLLNAVSAAANTSGVVSVSMSWGVGEVPQETSWDSYFTKPGVTFVAASGDYGAGTIWPAVSPNVVSVGGTTLHLTSSNTISSETGWGSGSWSSYFGGSGGGFSQYEPLPSYQKGITTSSNGFKYTSFGVRLNPDVAYVADPNTGLYVVANSSWYSVGGTSAGAPQWAALVAIADQGRALAHLSSLSSMQTLNALYANPSGFHDVTKGSTGTYSVYDNKGNVVGTIPVTAGPGYDLVTGLGTPIANKIVPNLAAATGSTAAAKVSATPTATQSTGSSSSSSKQSAGQKQAVISGLLLLPADVLGNSLTSFVPISSPSTPPVRIAAPVAPIQATGATSNHPILSASSGGSSAFTAVADDNSEPDDVPATATPTDSKSKAPPTPSPAAPVPEQREMQEPSTMGSRKEGRDTPVNDLRPMDDGAGAATAVPVLESESLAAFDPLAMAAGLALVLNGYWTPSLARGKEPERR
jgi:subtilase family serine protease